MNISILALGLTSVFSIWAAAQEAPKVNRVVTQKVVTTLNTFRDGTLTVSPDGRRFAYAHQAESGWIVEVDGKDEGTYEDVCVGESPYLVIVFDVFGLMGSKPMVFSRDNTHFAYSARKRKDWFVVHDGKMGRPFKTVGGPILSADGHRLAYRALNDRGWCVVVDGDEGKAYDKVGIPVFSPDGKHLAYAAKASNTEMMVIDGVEGKAYNNLENYDVGLGLLEKAASKLGYRTAVASRPVFSLDGQLAYVAKQFARWHIVVDGQESEPFEAVADSMSCLFYSPDGKKLAFSAKKGGIWTFSVDGRPFGHFPLGISTCVFSPDSQHIAFTVRSGGTESVLVDDRNIGTYGEVGYLGFSPDSQRLAFTAKTGGTYSLFVDDRCIGAYNAVGIPVFSPDSIRIAYAAKSGKTWALAVDGVLQKSYAGVGNPVFSPDGSHLAYSAELPYGRCVVVVDGTEGSPKQGFVKGARIVFDDSSHFHYLAVESGQVLLIEEEISVNPILRVLCLRRAYKISLIE